MVVKFANTLTERIILSMNNRINFSSKIAKEINSTYSGVNKVIKKLVESKIVDRNKDGRISYLTLTEKGLRLQNILKELKNENWK